MAELSAYLDLRQALLNFLSEDIGTGDITSDSLISPASKSDAFIICKAGANQKPVLSGIEEARQLFEICGCQCKGTFPEGSKITRGDTVLEIRGPSLSVLKAERTALNLLMRMSGIATETWRLKKELGRRKIEILATRKTAPGLRYFDKKAVVAGGGKTHRMRLDDMVLIKDNHIQIVGSADECVRRSRSVVGSSLKIECEARTRQEAISAIQSGADIIMLDNFSPAQCRATIREITRKGLRKKALIELSGGVNAKNILRFASSNPDYISIGYLTHSAPAVDFSLEVL